MAADPHQIVLTNEQLRLLAELAIRTGKINSRDIAVSRRHHLAVGVSPRQCGSTPLVQPLSGGTKRMSPLSGYETHSQSSSVG
jgi:hypothetical protein